MFRYRVLLIGSLFLVPILGLVRVLRGKDSVLSFLQRFYPASNETKSVVWLHAVSVGELRVLTLCLDALQNAHPNQNFLVTVSNIKAFEIAQRTLSDRASIAIAPLDYGFTLRRFFKIWQPKVLVTIENEVFPNRTLFCVHRNVPLHFVNARLSERSFDRWNRQPEFAKFIFSKFANVWAQDQRSAEFFRRLGVPKNAVSTIPNLKRLVLSQSHSGASDLPFPRQDTLLAASTHPGEDEIILNAFSKIKATNPNHHLIVAPRHVERGAKIAELAKSNGFKVKRRSIGEVPTETTEVYIADTMHEMHLWYQAAAMTFVCGSLKPIGGHTPYEPAQFNSAILHGPHYSNFESEYETLLQNEGSIECSTVDEIATAVLNSDAKLIAKNAQHALLNQTEAQLFLDRLADRIQV